jgi:hypothetical protein
LLEVFQQGASKQRHEAGHLLGHRGDLEYECAAKTAQHSGRDIAPLAFAAIAAAIYQFPEEAKEGGLLGYGPSIIRMYRELVAPLLIKLLRGAKPADLPIEQPTKFELAVNLKTARRWNSQSRKHF